jgi:hypothetical protein
MMPRLCFKLAMPILLAGRQALDGGEAEHPFGKAA